jgi:hypothetical protein
MTVMSSTKDDLFNLELIRSYVEKELNPRFVERHWLKKQVEEKLAEPDCRFLLLTAEPGAGKSAFMAWLAHQHPDWCRYFIRRDQRTPLGDVGSYSFLLQVGFQLVATYPDLFKQEQIKIVVEQRIGTAADSEIVGAEISKMFASPFYEKVIQIQQQVMHSKDTNITGVRIGEFYATERDLPLENLQFMALFDPAKAMMKQVQEAMDHPHQQIVVLVDALDELRYQDSELSLLKWLTNCPEVPANLRFVLTCRPDDDLLRAFRGNQQGWIQEILIAEEDPDVIQDLTRYTRFLIEMPEVNEALTEVHQDSDEFIHQATTKANGNFGYLGAIGRAIDEAIRQNQQELLREILQLSELPDTLQDLYAFFLSKIKDAVNKEKVPVEDAEGEIGFLPVWSAVYKPILGILSVALEPLTPTQIQKLGSIQTEFDYVTGAIERLQQFLDQLGNCYRLYHSTLPEFFTSPKTKERPDYSCCYVDAVKQNQRIVNYYQAGEKSWTKVDLQKIVEDAYGRSHLAQHLVKGDRIEELHKLLSLEKDGRNAWFKVKDNEGDIAGFLADLELAWFQANKCFEYEPDRSIGLQCRYALINASINSLAEMPAELMLALIKPPTPLWSASQVLTYALKIPDAKKRLKRLVLLIDQFPDSEILKPKLLRSSLETALKATQVTQDEFYPVDSLTELTDRLPQELLPEILEIALSVQHEYSRNKALTALAGKLPQDLLPKVLEAAITIQNEYHRIDILLALAKNLHLHQDLLPEVLDAALAIEYESNRVKVLIALADQFPEVQPKALEVALAIEDERSRVDALIEIGNRIHQDLLPKVLDATLAIKDKYNRARILIGFADKLPEVQTRALEAALAIENESDRARNLTALAGKCPEVKKQVLEAVLAIKSESVYVTALIELADKFPQDLLVKALEASRNLHDYSHNEALEELINKLSIIPDALEIAFSIQDESWGDKALLSLAAQLPQDLFSKALKAGLAIRDKYKRNEALAGLLKKLPKEPNALEIALDIQDEFWRDKALIALADKLPQDLVPQVLEAALAIDYDPYHFDSCHPDALVALIKKLALDLLYRTLEAALAIEDHFSRAFFLAVLSDRLPEVRPKALETALTIQNDYEPYRVQALIILSNQLPEVLPTALESALSLSDHWISDRIVALTTLTNKLPPNLLPKLLENVQTINDAEYRTQAIEVLTTNTDIISEDLGNEDFEIADWMYETISVMSLMLLIEKLPSEFLPELLKATLTIEHEYSRTCILSCLSSKLPSEQTSIAFDSDSDFEDDGCRIFPIEFLVENISPDLLPSILEVTLAIEENDLFKVTILVALLKRLPEALPKVIESILAIENSRMNDTSSIAEALKLLLKRCPDALSQAVACVSTICDKSCRANALTVLSYHLINKPDFIILWTTLLHSLSFRTRSELLSDLTALVPVITSFDKKAIAETVQAIQDVARWWP